MGHFYRKAYHTNHVRERKIELDLQELSLVEEPGTGDQGPWEVADTEGTDDDL
ncbi:hypothetical protein UFOVP1287_9 [uncultured Caudovirales phage]|uniref:Uncharacterized protein n=1 Tax=uncultured Caudovirales phage TaxID=2100421 RepID=A0A6J5RPC4_9CAUD|nr:hypothetical protein UFOVP1287_9 [uncultured Caudovirales phage]CAB4205155.1 hypothetical protein UFOVP1408_31 [uncultured Caudovirales phage]